MNGGVELVSQFGGFHRDDRVVIGSEFGHLRIIEKFVVAMPAPLGGSGRCAVRDDAIQPGAELRGAPELVEAALRTEVGVLHHVSRILLVAGQPKCQAVRIVICTANHFVERLALARNRPLDEIVDGGIHEFGPAISPSVT